VALAIWHPELIPALLQGAAGLKWASGLANTIYQSLVDCYTSADSFTSDLVLNSLSEVDKTALLELLFVVEESYKDVELNELANEIALYLEILRKRSSVAHRQKLVLAIAEAEKQQDRIKLAELLEELNQLNN
jgi:hypothetical protein